jgi:putative endonuclease
LSDTHSEELACVISTGGPRGGPEWRNLVTNDKSPYNRDMVWSKTYYVYIMASQSRTSYVGFTDNIERRVWQHKTGEIEGFTERYKIDTLVYVESFGDVYGAIAREKQIKRWARGKKLRLIEQMNPDWRDLSGGWY